MPGYSFILARDLRAPYKTGSRTVFEVLNFAGSLAPQSLSAADRSA